MSHPYIHFGTIVARGSRTRSSSVAFGSLRPFGPGSNVASSSRTRGSSMAFNSLRPFGPGSNVARGSSVGSLTNQEIMSHLYIHFGTSVARGLRTRGLNVAFGSLRPFGPGSNVARGSSLGSLTNQEIMSHLYNTLWDNCRTRFEDTRFECGLRLPKALLAWFKCCTPKIVLHALLKRCCTQS